MKKSILAFFLSFSMLLTGFGVIATEDESEITEAVEQQALTVAPSLLQELEGMTAEEFAQVPLITGEPIEESEEPMGSIETVIHLTDEEREALVERNRLEIERMEQEAALEMHSEWEPIVDEEAFHEAAGDLENGEEVLNEAENVTDDEPQSPTVMPNNAPAMMGSRLEAKNRAPMVAAKNKYTLYLKADGTVWAWGDLYYKDHDYKSFKNKRIRICN